jgi:hypothetical protein
MKKDNDEENCTIINYYYYRLGSLKEYREEGQLSEDLCLSIWFCKILPSG